ncbi:MAG: serine/threonine-protein phosphatase [Rhodospirillaceae bacterium]|nr:serine/threonine-protein phosphatase [Rhodospirillaceae bacterium]MCA8932113.1 serine/threonine-protein phosphatase [Rhodospirillaceae bacterium]
MAGKLVIDSAALSDVGTRRRLNEDAYLARPDLGLFAVADGMGGHDAGDQASNAVVSALDSMHGPMGAGQLIAAVRTLLDQVHLDLQAEAERRGSKRGIGSTVVVLMVNGGHYCALWAGDSRIYLARAGELLQLTEDHSYVQELVNQGVLSPQDAEHHPQSNVITRAVGVDTELRLDKVTNRVQPGDVFLLCSDGLTREVTAEEIRMELMSGDPNRAVRNLIDLALDRGASDNVTAVAVRLAIAPADSPSGRDEEDTNPPPGEMVYGRQGRPTPRPRSHDRPRPFV